MNFQHPTASLSPSSSSTSTSTNNHPNNNNNNTTDPMSTWWESISKARTHIHLLSTLLPSSAATSLSSLADSDRPARSLLSSYPTYSALSLSFSSPSSGSGNDPLCHWLYDTFLSSDPDLRLVVLNFVPLISTIYLTRIHSHPGSDPGHSSLSGFEAVLLAIYTNETKSRNGKPILINLPDLSLPSLYHTPRITHNAKTTPIHHHNNNNNNNNNHNKTRLLSPPLEPQTAVKSTKRGCIIGVALECYYKCISQMPSWSKLDFCKFAADWAGEDCVCKFELDEISSYLVVEEVDVENNGGLNEDEDGEIKGGRIPLPWEVLQPVLRILGHCLLGPLNSDEVKDAASVAVRCLYARASHELMPQALLATRSLIQLDKRAREAAQLVAAVNVGSSNVNTPSKAKKPEILLVSK